jgi:2-polyprenyl-3-methyl-5-hydroxy-6-metoxy-1,4-benzoquinol methylase
MGIGTERPLQKEHPASGWAQVRRTRGPHPYVLSRICEIPRSDRARIKILDVPAGRGVIALPLRAAGFNVVGLDLFPRHFEETVANVRDRSMEEVFLTFRRGKFSESLRRGLFLDPSAAVPTDVECVRGDMEDRLPFSDGEFNYVVSMEGIEHINNRHQALSEFRRVLKPHGTLLISTPNMLSLRARLAYALSGQRTFKAYLDEYTGTWGRSADGARVYHGHAFLINYFQLRYSLHHCGFRIRQLLRSTRSPSSVALLPFMWPFVVFFTWLSQRAGRKDFVRRTARGEISSCSPPFDEILRHVLSPRMLLTTVLILEAEAV